MTSWLVLEVDSNLVRPGWTALVVVVLLGIVLALLGRSMLKQFGKIDVPADHEPADHDPAQIVADDAPEPTRAADERTVRASEEQPIPDLRAARSGDTPPTRS